MEEARDDLRAALVNSRAQTARARAVQDFYLDAIFLAGQEGGTTRSTHVIDVIAAAADLAEDFFVESPDIAVEILSRVARSFVLAGRSDEARDVVERALTIQGGILDPAVATRATLLMARGEILPRGGRARDGPARPRRGAAALPHARQPARVPALDLAPARDVGSGRGRARRARGGRRAPACRDRAGRDRPRFRAQRPPAPRAPCPAPDRSRAVRRGGGEPLPRLRAHRERLARGCPVRTPCAPAARGARRRAGRTSRALRTGTSSTWSRRARRSRTSVSSRVTRSPWRVSCGPPASSPVARSFSRWSTSSSRTELDAAHAKRGQADCLAHLGETELPDRLYREACDAYLRLLENEDPNRVDLAASYFEFLQWKGAEQRARAFLREGRRAVARRGVGRHPGSRRHAREVPARLRRHRARGRRPGTAGRDRWDSRRVSGCGAPRPARSLRPHPAGRESSARRSPRPRRGPPPASARATRRAWPPRARGRTARARTRTGARRGTRPRALRPATTSRRARHRRRRGSGRS